MALDWTAIVVQTLATAGVLGTAFAPFMVSLSRKADKAEKYSKIARDETRNAHDPARPLRHDIDILLERTSSIPSMKKDIGGIRADVRTLFKGQLDLWDTVADTAPSERKRHDLDS